MKGNCVYCKFRIILTVRTETAFTHYVCCEKFINQEFQKGSTIPENRLLDFLCPENEHNICPDWEPKNIKIKIKSFLNWGIK